MIAQVERRSARFVPMTIETRGRIGQQGKALLTGMDMFRRTL